MFVLHMCTGVIARRRLGIIRGNESRLTTTHQSLAPKQSSYNEMQDWEARYRCDKMQTFVEQGGGLKLLHARHCEAPPWELSEATSLDSFITHQSLAPKQSSYNEMQDW